MTDVSNKNSAEPTPVTKSGVGSALKEKSNTLVDDTLNVSITNNKIGTESKVNNPVVLNRSVKIRRKNSTSLYLQQNLKHFPDRKAYIGASGTSARTMLRNVKELEKYMPSLINTNPTNTEFYGRCKTYFDNIAVFISDNDKELDCSFIFADESNYKEYDRKFNAILTKFEKADKSRPETRNEAFKVRDAEIIELESTIYEFGMPINISDYILYRHCLVYSPVVSDIALINSRGDIEFYLVDDRLEATKKNFLHDVRKKAHKYFSKLYDDKVKRTNILYSMGTRNVAGMSEVDQMSLFETMVVSDPMKLCNLYEDSRLSEKSTIEQLIQIGVLKRYSNTSAILNQDDEIVGKDTEATIAYMNDPSNRSKVSIWRTKLNQLL